MILMITLISFKGSLVSGLRDKIYIEDRGWQNLFVVQLPPFKKPLFRMLLLEPRSSGPPRPRGLSSLLIDPSTSRGGTD